MQLAEVERALDRLEADLRRMEIDYRRFFAGDLDLPPDDLVEGLQLRLRRLQVEPLQSAVHQFKLGTLEARFNSYREMFGRRLRNLEEGREPVRRTASGEGDRVDVDAGVIVGQSVPRAAVEALLQGIAEHSAQAPRMDLDTFHAYLDRQVAAIREKTGCARVQFRLAVEDGKAKLKAKPVGATAPSR